MTDQNKKNPVCFGELDIVFPKGRDGLRITPESCLACGNKTECLRTAVEGAGGLKIQEELVDRAYGSGTMSFIKRWSKKKDIKRRLEKKAKGKG